MSYNILHKDICHNISIYLKIRDIINFGLTCKEINLSFKDDFLWKILINRDYKYFKYKDNITWFNLYKITYNNEIFIKKRTKKYNFDKVECHNLIKRHKILQSIGLIYNIRSSNYEKMFVDVINNIINRKILDHITFSFISKIKRGDIITLEIFDLIDEFGILIYNGTEIESLFHRSTKNIFYGYESLSEFPINYWKDAVCMNTHIYINDNYIDIIINKIIENMDENFTSKEYAYVVKSSFTYYYSIYIVYIITYKLDNIVCNVNDFKKLLKSNGIWVYSADYPNNLIEPHIENRCLEISIY
jgi:hypothetical protein